ncbi:MAG: MCE family protein [Acidobacteria bacterium]|nr:MCE family protein [Acidobacteriota bacterium]
MKLETKVGAFFILTIVVIGVLVLRVEKLELGSNKGAVELHTYFDQVAGLAVQSAIRVAGVKVGEVRKIDLEGRRAKVTLFLQKDKVKVYRDAVASLSSIGILGEKYIELDPGHPAAGDQEAAAPIRSKTGISLDNLMETMGIIGEDLKGISYALNKTIGGEDGRQKLDEIVNNIRVLTAEFRAMAQENHGSINRTLGNVEAITAELKDKLPKLASQFDELGRNLNQLIAENRPEIKGVVGDVRRLATSFQATSDNLKSITAKLDKGEGTIGKLLTDETTIKKINTAVDNVNDMLGGFRNMQLNLDLNAARWTARGDSKTGVGIDIVPRKDYWYALELNSTPDGKIQDSTRTVTKLDPATGKPVETTERVRSVTADQSLTVSAQFAKRLGDAVFTAGIVEGKGGGGAELRFFDDRLRLGALAYDFTKRDDKPKVRVRATTSLEVWKGFYLQAGGQDLANKELRSFFLGGGIRWKDDDLKKLVGLAGAAK